MSYRRGRLNRTETKKAEVPEAQKPPADFTNQEEGTTGLPGPATLPSRDSLLRSSSFDSDGKESASCQSLCSDPVSPPTRDSEALLTDSDDSEESYGPTGANVGVPKVSPDKTKTSEKAPAKNAASSSKDIREDWTFSDTDVETPPPAQDSTRDKIRINSAPPSPQIARRKIKASSQNTKSAGVFQKSLRRLQTMFAGRMQDVQDAASSATSDGSVEREISSDRSSASGRVLDSEMQEGELERPKELPLLSPEELHPEEFFENGIPVTPSPPSGLNSGDSEESEDTSEEEETDSDNSAAPSSPTATQTPPASPAPRSVAQRGSWLDILKIIFLSLFLFLTTAFFVFMTRLILVVPSFVVTPVAIASTILSIVVFVGTLTVLLSLLTEFTYR